MQNWATNDTVITLLYLAGIVVLSFVIYGVARWGLVRAIRGLARRSAFTWDDALVDAQVFARMAHIAPALFVYYAVDWVPGLKESPGIGESLHALIQRVAISLMLIVTAVSASSFLTAVNQIYTENPRYRHPIKGYLTVVNILIFALTGLIVIATLMDKSPWIFISGVGAMTAVLLLIFKDTILSLVASIQIAGNDMIHIGDWIEMPEVGADGDVIDVALHTVKVQNWDKTISTIPTHRLISDSFKNWRGMSESGGRRIKRSFSVDVSTVRFLTSEEIERFGSWSLLKDYISGKVDELASYNAGTRRNAELNADIRRLTNIGTLRAYIEQYLRTHPKIHGSGYTLLVRQLAIGATGVPIEIYCFSNDQDWGRYEGIQADIFDHILAIIHEFGLRLYQQPAGADLTNVMVQRPGG